jgi:hypothetical protein
MLKMLLNVLVLCTDCRILVTHSEAEHRYITTGTWQPYHPQHPHAYAVVAQDLTAVLHAAYQG